MASLRLSLRSIQLVQCILVNGILVWTVIPEPFACSGIEVAWTRVQAHCCLGKAWFDAGELGCDRVGMVVRRLDMVKGRGLVVIW